MMKKMTLFVAMVAIVAIASDDVFAQRGRGRRGGGPRPGTRPGARAVRPQPNHSFHNPAMPIRPGTPTLDRARRLESPIVNARTGYRAASRYPYHHPHHRPYYHGWHPAWWKVPVAWGIGVAWWNWNAADPYYNPYATYVRDTAYDYSEPVYTDAEEAAIAQDDPFSSTEGSASTEMMDYGSSDDQTSSAMDDFAAARDAFKTNDYPMALREVDHAIKKLPRDAALHEFRALTLFAMGKYNRAAAVLNSVLASGPGWDWDTMIGLYQDPKEYIEQLHNLEDFTRRHKQDVAAKFLLAYQYLLMGFMDKAEVQLKEVVRLQPRDVLSKRLIEMIEQSKKQEKLTPSTLPIPGE